MTIILAILGGLLLMEIGFLIGANVYRSIANNAIEGWRVSLEGWKEAIELGEGFKKKLEVKSDSVVSPIQIKKEL